MISLRLIVALCLCGSFFGAAGLGEKSSDIPSDLCKIEDADAIVQLSGGQIYVFKGKYYWLVNEEGGFLGEPKLIAQDWDGLPHDLDAGFTGSDRLTYFFKGDQFWMNYDDEKSLFGPMKIADKFPGVPSDLDGAFYKSEKDSSEYSNTGSVYFFKGGQVVEHKLSKSTVMDYPAIFRQQVQCKDTEERGLEINSFFDGPAWTTSVTLTV